MISVSSLGLAHGRQQHALADGDRDVVVVCLEAERAGHAAAAGVEQLVVEAELLEHRVLGVERHDVLVVAVPLHERLAR